MYIDVNVLIFNTWNLYEWGSWTLPLILLKTIILLFQVGSEVSAYLDDLTSDLEICVEALNAGDDKRQRSPEDDVKGLNGSKVAAAHNDGAAAAAAKYEGDEEEEDGTQEQDSQWVYTVHHG